MAEYVTLIEAAELEGVKYKTMAQRLNRNPDKFDTMTEKSENGGKDAVLVAVASLSKKARNAWKERAKLKELSGTISPEGEAQPEPEAPWYVEADVDWYIENYREQWYKGMELGNVIREFLQYDGANKTEYAEQYAQEHLGSGKRTLYRYVKAYNEACAWADKLQKESGVGFEFFKVLCLCRKPKESGTFPSIKPEVKQVIKNIWFNEDFAANLGTREMLYEKLTLVANVNKWEKIPSYQTVTRYITYLMEDEGMKNAHFLASKGSREYKNKVMVKGSRDTSGLKVIYKRAEAVLEDQYEGDVGYNPGSQMIQIAGISVLDELDHFIKEQLGIKRYLRYMDDFLLMHEDLEYLEYCKDKAIEKLAEYGFEPNPKKTKVIPITEEILFLGFYYRLTETGKIIMRLNPANVKQERKKLWRVLWRID